ncbi:MAG: TenA family protein [Bacteroidales bacterium]|nr:TenA family protein [Candidatus Colimorpha onthohippi]
MKKWTEEAWAEASGIYADIIDHPFILELADGTLSVERFKRYIAQDELYLGNYGRQMYAFADMIGDASQKQMFMEFAKAGLEGEKAMHQMMIARFGIDASASPSKVTAAYNDHTEAAIQTGCKEIALASLLPCIWIYNEVGKHLKAIAVNAGNPYREWIDEYGNEDFSASVANILSLIDEYAGNTNVIIRKEMTSQFREGVHFEYQFWDYAYKGE